ncbi:MAG: shikimate kinase, partial [Clostridia bacterium]|nr:shikimate kinase [Clostridia bacterium]
MKQFGLIGEKLGHSHSKTLHGYLADYSYELWPMPREELDEFLRRADFDGINVTIPYKKDVIPYLSEMGETARRIGCVNTIVKRADGSLYGDNTDAYGMSVMAQRAGIRFEGKKTLILGSGGTSLTAQAVVHAAGGEAVVISRSGENNYENIEKHADAAYLINTTPVGMYPHVDASPVDLKRLPKLQGVLDVVYNPLRTKLLQQAEILGIPHEGGLCMLVYQAVRACELFIGEKVSDERVRKAEKALRKSITNLVLIGMPGCGKSTIGAMLAQELGMPVVDLDEEIVKAAGMSIPDIFAKEGESGFREREAEQVKRFGSEGGRVIITGGGAVKREANRDYLRMNGVVVQLTRPLELLPTDGRPLSRNREALEAMWQERAPMYAACADRIIANNAGMEECVRKIKEGF